MQIDLLKKSSSFNIEDLDSHVSRKFIERFVFIKGVLLSNGNGTRKVKVVTTSRNSNDEIFGSLGERRASVFISTIEFLTRLEVVGLRTVTTVVSESDDLRSTLTIVVKSTVVLRTSGKVNVNYTGRSR